MRFILNFIIITILSVQLSFADGGIIAYYKVGEFKGTIEEVAQKLKTALEKPASEDISPFKIIGEYSPGKNEDMLVIAFTRDDLIKITTSIENRGALASVLRIGLRSIKKKRDKTVKVEVSLLNPDYLFYSYLRNNINKYENELSSISEDVKLALMSIENAFFFPIGTGSLSESELKEFKYMVKMPSFNDPIVIKEFSNFNQGVRKIMQNLQARKGGTYRVFALLPKDYAGPKKPSTYKIFPESSKIAVFGVGLMDQRIGEAKFLSELGASHLTAMPYELILEDKKASILHGRFRFPLFWSNLTMEDFRKIYKTPRDIEEIMKGLTK